MKNLVTDIFFDLDHTLWDFERNSAQTFHDLFKGMQLSIDVPKFLEAYIPINHHFWKLYRDDEITKDELRYLRLSHTFDKMKIAVTKEIIDHISNAYIENLPQQNHLIQDALEVLNYLAPNYGLHIITNGFEEVQLQKMRSSGLDTFFREVINSETAGVKKPHFQIFDTALRRVGIPAHKAVMIGDNLEADILGGRNAGMHVIFFNPEREECPEGIQEIKSLNELLGLL